MSQYTAHVAWKRQSSEPFTDNKYSRAHVWRFDGGAEVPASSAPAVVKPPLSDPAGVDPEEALVASLSSCHMLTFLYLAAKRGFRVDEYIDEAVGILEKNSEGRLAMTKVTLRPAIRWGEKRPTSDELGAMHHDAHDQCFIANSVKTDVRVEPRESA